MFDLQLQRTRRLNVCFFVFVFFSVKFRCGFWWLLLACVVSLRLHKQTKNPILASHVQLFLIAWEGTAGVLVRETWLEPGAFWKSRFFLLGRSFSDDRREKIGQAKRLHIIFWISTFHLMPSDRHADDCRLLSLFGVMSSFFFFQYTLTSWLCLDKQASGEKCTYCASA